MADLKTNFALAAETTLSSSLSASGTTLNVTDSSAFPATPFYVVIDPGNDDKREVVLVDDSKTGTTLVLSSATSRGQDDTTATTHESDAVVAIVPTAAAFKDLHDRIDGHVHYPRLIAALSAGSTETVAASGSTDASPTWTAIEDDEGILSGSNISPAVGEAWKFEVVLSIKMTSLQLSIDDIYLQGQAGVGATNTYLYEEPSNELLFDDTSNFGKFARLSGLVEFESTASIGLTISNADSGSSHDYSILKGYLFMERIHDGS